MKPKHWDMIHDLEERYGSIKNVPKNEPELMQLQKEIGIVETHDSQLEQDIEELIFYGYKPSEIIDEVQISKYLLNKIKSKLGLSYIPMFTYKLTNHDEPDIYLTSFKQINVIIHKAPSTRIPLTLRHLKEHGFKHHEINLYWGDIPEDAIYVVGRKVFQKNGLKSYRKIEVANDYLK